MRLVLGLVVVALHGIGILTHAQTKECGIKETYFRAQAVNIQRMELLLKRNVQWLRNYCQLDLPPILNETETEPSNQFPLWPENELESVPWPFPPNLRLVVLYPPGSPCNPSLPKVNGGSGSNGAYYPNPPGSSFSITCAHNRYPPNGPYQLYPPCGSINGQYTGYRTYAPNNYPFKFIYPPHRRPTNHRLILGLGRPRLNIATPSHSSKYLNAIYIMDQCPVPSQREDPSRLPPPQNYQFNVNGTLVVQPKSLENVQPKSLNNGETNTHNNFQSINLNNIIPKDIKILQLNPPTTWVTETDIKEDAKLKTVELIRKYGFPVETHFVTTSDKYVLCLHRIPRPGAPVILLVHGLMSSSASWVQMGPSNGLAYLLYQQGYDVWLLNTRGNIYSSDHLNPNIDPADYWSFSFHEIGTLDLPVTIDRILEVTEVPQIQYIGHSQGSTVFFVMCSELPEYCQKVTLMQALSPTVFMQHTQSPVLRFLGMFSGKFGVLLNIFGGYKISNANNVVSQFRNHICQDNAASQICAIFDFVMCGFGWNQFNTTLTPLVVGHASQGASMYQIYHFAQLISGIEFQKIDLGELLNQEQYQRPRPPAYNLTEVSCKVAIHHAREDWLSTPADVQVLVQRLPNVVDNWNIQSIGFSHYDYIISTQVNPLVNSRLINNCFKHSSLSNNQYVL